jgi:hypothetical protein
MRKRTAITTGFLLAGLLVVHSHGAGALDIAFERGDVFVSLESGPVQWWTETGVPRGVLAPTVAGTGEGMAFDNSGNLYVTRWCYDPMCSTGNTVEMFSSRGYSLGPTGRGYNCTPHAIVFDWTGPNIGSAYVGQSGCRKSILKFVPGELAPSEFLVAEDNLGVFWLDLASDRCVLFYTSFGPNVKRYDACAGTQLPDFNLAPLPGGIAQDVRVLPGGGVLVSSGQVIVRLDPGGAVAQTYEIPGEGALWAGIDLVDDGTFWAGNYFSSNVYRFDLSTGLAITGFNSGTPANSVVGVRVKK